MNLMPVPPPGRDNLHTEMRLVAVVELLDNAVRALRQTINDIQGSAKPTDGGGTSADLIHDGPQE